LPAVKRRYPKADRATLARELDPAFHAFNRARRENLQLYPEVEEALAELRSAGVRIVGCTEAAYVNALQRLRMLGVDRHFERVYAAPSDVIHPNPERVMDSTSRDERLRLLPPSERKPDPRVLLDICSAEGADPSEAVYVGDSLTRDVSMANAAGVPSVWAKYGTEYDKELWGLLVSISHWTDEEVARETRIREDADLRPQFVIETFGEIVPIMLRPSTS
jgi:phosphoglycolate phosphatase